MKVSKLFQGTVNASASKDFSITNKHINGLIIGIDNTPAALFGADCFLSIILRDARETEVLANRIPLRVFAAISDIQGGLSVNAQQKARGDAGTVAQNECMAIAIDFGSLHIGKGRLEIEYENGGQAYTMFFGSYSVEESPDHMVKYSQTAVLKSVLGNTKSVFYYDPTHELTAPGIDVNFELKAHNETELCTSWGLALATMALGEVESTPSPETIAVFLGDDVPDTVTVNVTGTDADGSLIHVSHIYKDYRVALSTYNNATKTASRLEKIEKQSPQVAKAYRYAGITGGKSAVYRAVAKRAKIPPS